MVENYKALETVLAMLSFIILLRRAWETSLYDPVLPTLYLTLNKLEIESFQPLVLAFQPLMVYFICNTEIYKETERQIGLQCLHRDKLIK